MKRWTVLFLLLPVLFLSACAGKKDVKCEVILEEVAREIGGGSKEDALSGLPAGEVYVPGKAPGEEGYLWPFVLESLYGAHAEEAFSQIEDYAVYLSSVAEPYEIAVFRCCTVSDADGVVELCRERRDLLQTLLRDTDFRQMTDCIRIIRHGKYVVMTLTADPGKTESAARGAPNRILVPVSETARSASK